MRYNWQKPKIMKIFIQKKCIFVIGIIRRTILLTQITASHPEENEAAKQMFQIATKLKQGLSPQAILLGPTPNAIMRVNNRYFYQVIIKYKQEPMLQPLLKEILTDTQRATARGLKLSIDAEPMNFI